MTRVFGWVFAAVMALASAANASQPLVGADRDFNLVLNSSAGKKVLVNGYDMTEALQMQAKVLDRLAALEARVGLTLAPVSSPTNVPTRSPVRISPTVTPPIFQGLQYNNETYGVGDTITINQSRVVHKLSIEGIVVLKIEAWGGAGGEGTYGTPGTGAPGGRIVSTYKIQADRIQKLYVFVGEKGNSYSNAGGSGGGSTDIRTKYDGSLTDVENAAFLTDFSKQASLESRFVVAGGGGGAHGGTAFGYWGATNSPGAGCFYRGDPNGTSSFGYKDGGHTTSGATTTEPGLDGGTSVNAIYTASGRYGVAGIPKASSADFYVEGTYSNAQTKYTSMGWPNGGPGNNWAVGGGGGGWYGGATNWPNGGGGSSYSSGTIIANECAQNPGSGMIKITVIEAEQPRQNQTITFNEVTYYQGDVITLNAVEDVQRLSVSGLQSVMIEAAGAKGGNGGWDSSNQSGAPGGTIIINATLQDGEYFAFVGKAGKYKDGVRGCGGGGGGSSDLRTVFDASKYTTPISLQFYNAFMEKSSLDSRLFAAGAGGGAHGGGYGYWGNSDDHPGAGGPNRTYTNCGGNQDASHVDCGATQTGPGLDAGQSIDSRYTANGIYGSGGIQEPYTDAYTASTTKYTGMGWPNGGSGTDFANGGGGGGWYGGATNWPNGGGGSSVASANTTVVANIGANNMGDGYIKITLL